MIDKCPQDFTIHVFESEGIDAEALEAIVADVDMDVIESLDLREIPNSSLDP